MVKRLYDMVANDRCEEVLDYIVEDLSPEDEEFLHRAIAMKNQLTIWKQGKNAQIMNEQDLQTHHSKLVMSLNALIADLHKNNLIAAKQRTTEIANSPALKTIFEYNSSQHANLDIVHWIGKNRYLLSQSIGTSLAQKYLLDEDYTYLFKGALSDFLKLLQDALAKNELGKLDDPSFVFKQDRFEVTMVTEAMEAIVKKLPEPPRVEEVSKSKCSQYIAYFRNQLKTYR